MKRGDFCPLIKGSCVELKCLWYTQIRGVNPQTGADVTDEWGCAVAWLPMLLIENAQQQRHTGAAVESFRNEMVKANEVSRQMFRPQIAAEPAPPQIADDTSGRV